ncbi:hypothetical protein FACS1894109_19580 [Spirochaetia bacterium]|nr:hypothetical protein FACS1894109_19580 [Spirochaetia bacterium]
MKSVRQRVMVLLAITAAMGIFLSCASNDGARAERIELDSKGKAVTLEHKGTGLGVDKLPQWLAEYMDRGVRGVEDLADYQGKYCIVAFEQGPELQAVLTWTNNFNAQQQIAQQISTSAASVFKANESKVPDGDDSQRKYSNAINTLVSASYSGARQEGDWWVKQRISEGKNNETRYTAYVLYSIDRKVLDKQIADAISKNKDGSPGLDAAFDAVTAQILSSGLQWQ